MSIPTCRCLPVFLSAALLSTLLAACSPRFDWRDVRLDDLGMQALLPCKPDRGERGVPLAGRDTTMRMVGCDNAGATFAIAYAPVADAEQAGVVMAQWQEAVRRNLAASATEVASAPYRVAAAAALPAPVTWTVRGQRPAAATGGAAPVVAHTGWFVRRQAGVLYVVHAAMYAPGDESEAAETFLTGLR